MRIRTNAFRLLTFLTTFSFLGVIVAESRKVSANLLCDIFPFIESMELTSPLCGGGDATSTATTLSEWLKFGVSLVFIGIIGIAIFVIIKSALKYIQSEGDESKVEEARKSIKNVFIGVGALIVGLIGLVLILGIFGATDTGLDNPDEGSVPDVIQPFLN